MKGRGSKVRKLKYEIRKKLEDQKNKDRKNISPFQLFFFELFSDFEFLL